MSVKRSKLKKNTPQKKKVLTIFESDSLELEKAMEKLWKVMELKEPKRVRTLSVNNSIYEENIFHND